MYVLRTQELDVLLTGLVSSVGRLLVPQVSLCLDWGMGERNGAASSSIPGEMS